MVSARVPSHFKRSLQLGEKIPDDGVIFAEMRNLVSLRTKIVGHAVAQLIEALRYKPGCRGFDSR